MLDDYDSDRYGPLFAVSDEGSAGPVVVDAAYASAKAAADPGCRTDPLALGVILDGERMTSAGEVPIGPPEYRPLAAAGIGKVLLTTNVGTRVNVRLTGQLPEFPVAGDGASAAVIAAFKPFLDTPDHHPRPLTVRLRVQPGGADLKSLATLVHQVDDARAKGACGAADVHRLSVLVTFDSEITTDKQVDQIVEILSAAARIGITEVAVDGEPLPAARRRWGVQGLLNVLEIPHLNRLLAVARENGVRLAPRYQVDVESAARTVWTGLHTARASGFDAGKYGLLPLTLEEQVQVIELITRWTEGWTAIPAFYVDTPLVTAAEAIGVEQCAAAARRWLKAARGAGATVVLFDAPDRVTPRKLVKSADSPDGVLTVDEIAGLADYARVLGMNIMWSGGITAPQAFELARRGVHAIFSTSSTAAKMAVTAQFDRDPRLPAENEPTDFGVRRMHAIIQGGFLSAKLAGAAGPLAKQIEAETRQLVDSGGDAAKAGAALAALNGSLIEGWRRHLSRTGGDEAGPLPPGRPDGGTPRPVPADACRVFRGRMRAGTARAAFIERLGQVFMPMTIQVQRLYGLAAYLPAVLPAADGKTGVDAVPDEVALVFYRTQDCYHESKRCIGGRAYSELHELAFDMGNSHSGFPSLFAGAVERDQPYHLFDRAVEWQTGITRLYVGTRKAGIEPAAFLPAVAGVAAQVQSAPSAGPDAAIFCATDTWVVWWEHWPAPPPDEQAALFDKIADRTYAGTARRIRVPTDLTVPYAGLSLNPDGDFVNLHFPRL